MEAGDVVLVDDDPDLRAYTCSVLEGAGYTVRQAGSGREAWTLVQERAPDLVVLDLELREVDGLEVLAGIRARGDVPVLVLTAGGAGHGRSEALERGADDHLIRPLRSDQFLAGVRALVAGRGGDDEDPVLRVGSVELDDRTRGAVVGGVELSLSPSEYGVLRLLLQSAGSPVPTTVLLSAVWGPGAIDRPHYVRAAVHNLCAELEAHGLDGFVIEASPPIGYRLRVPGREEP